MNILGISAFYHDSAACLVQDGIIDELFMFRKGRPGPLPALEKYLAKHPEFEIDHERCGRFLITHHPKGWLKRVQ